MLLSFKNSSLFSLKEFASPKFPCYGLSGDCHEYFPEKMSNISCSVCPCNRCFYLLFPSWISLTFPSWNVLIFQLYCILWRWGGQNHTHYSTGRLALTKGLVSWHLLLCPPPFQMVGSTLLATHPTADCWDVLRDLPTFVLQSLFWETAHTHYSVICIFKVFLTCYFSLDWIVSVFLSPSNAVLWVVPPTCQYISKLWHLWISAPFPY